MILLCVYIDSFLLMYFPHFNMVLWNYHSMFYSGWQQDIRGEYPKRNYTNLAHKKHKLNTFTSYNGQESKTERNIRMRNQMVFKRYEIKYLLTPEQMERIKERMASHMVGDVHGRNTIFSLYYDTPDFLLARRSMEKPVYKEKLRLRSYGVPAPDTEVFVEIKKKYRGVVYKRRISMEKEASDRYLLKGEKVQDTQISREIDFLLRRYGNMAPSILLSYEREAYYEKDNHEFRVTFDENVLWRDKDMDLEKGVYGEAVLPPGRVLMEVKTADAIPLWFTEILSELKVYKTSFSKYGNAYKAIYERKKTKVG